MSSNNVLYNELISKIEEIQGYNSLYKLFNLTTVSSSQECIFEQVAFRNISSIKATVFSENWQSLKGNFRGYLLNRSKESHNPFAKCRYDAILAMLFSNSIIDAYNENVDLLNVSIQNDIDHTTLTQLLYCILSIYNLALKKRISIQSDIDIHHIFSVILKSKTISIKNRRQILSFIASADFSALKVSEITDLMTSCSDILNASEHSPMVKQHLIKDCITLCHRLMETDSDRYSEMLKNLWEQYGDNEYNFLVERDDTNLMVAHINAMKIEGIIEAYKKAGNENKLIQANKEFVYWKNLQVFPKITVQLFEEKDIEEIERRLRLARAMNIECLLSCIATNYFNIIPSDSQLQSSDKEYETQNTYSNVNIDTNGNSQPISEDEENEYKKYYNLGVFMKPIIYNFTQLMLDRITEKTISFSKLKSVLIKKTILGLQYENYCGQKQTLFDIINEPLKNLFSQLTKITKQQHINFLVPLDTLGIKIERILRDILFLNGQPIKKTTPQGKNRLYGLDDILNTVTIKKLYSPEDLNFIYFTLTDRGYNLRNDAAHGFYGDEYYKTGYGLHYCMCLLMCIIRIAINYNPQEI